MARNRTTPAEKAQHSSRSEAHSGGDGHGPGKDSPQAQDWLHGTMASPQMAVDSLLEMQRQWLKTASMGSETLALELKELQHARDPVEFVSAQFSLVNQQMEIFTRQVAAVMQQIYDAQLMWIGQWDEKHEESASAPSPAAQSRSALSALSQVQEEWLKATQSWVDSLSAGSHSH